MTVVINASFAELSLSGYTAFPQETHIVPLICKRIASKLEEEMQVYVDEDDPRRATVIKIGRFQDNPLNAKVYISVQGGDAEKPELRDGVIALDDFDKIDFYIPTREIGGGSMWWRHGVCQFGCYFRGDTEDDSRTMAYQVLGRICECIDTVVVSDLEDHFGERAYKAFLAANSIFESGGPPTNYVWRGKVNWMVLTERSR